MARADRLRDAVLELADEADLGLEFLGKLFEDGLLRERDQRAHIRRGSAAEVHDDVCVDVRDLCAADGVSLEPALINEASRAYSLDFLEDRTGARVQVEPWVARSAPAEVFLHHAMHEGGIALCEAERHGERNFTRVVEPARVVAELHLRAGNREARAGRQQQLDIRRNLFNEGGPLAGWRR